MNRELRIGTRGSLLAVAQAERVASELRRRYPELTPVLVKIKTSGDMFAHIPLSHVGGKGLFIKEIEEALLDGQVDVAVHSMKDVPTEIAPGLSIAAILEREDASARPDRGAAPGEPGYSAEETRHRGTRRLSGCGCRGKPPRAAAGDHGGAPARDQPPRCRPGGPRPRDSCTRSAGTRPGRAHDSRAEWLDDWCGAGLPQAARRGMSGSDRRVWAARGGRASSRGTGDQSGRDRGGPRRTEGAQRPRRGGRVRHWGRATAAWGGSDHPGAFRHNPRASRRPLSYTLMTDDRRPRPEDETRPPGLTVISQRSSVIER